MDWPHEYATVFGKLTAVQRHGWGWSAKCPSHDDVRRSLSVRLGRDGSNLMVKCHAGCEFRTIQAALGLAWQEFTTHREEDEPIDLSRQTRVIAETYSYTDERGAELYQVVRYDPKDFRQRCRDGNGWKWSIDGVRLVPYRLPKLSANATRQTVFVPEGEKDVHTLERIGLLATTNAGGAGKWKPEFGAYIAGCPVVLLPHNDEPGRKHATQVSELLRPYAASAKVLRLPGLALKEDVSDWLKGCGTKAELLRLVDSTPFAWQRCHESIPEVCQRIASRADLDPRDWVTFARGVLCEYQEKIAKKV